jgi:cytochrome c551/c552
LHRVRPCCRNGGDRRVRGHLGGNGKWGEVPMPPFDHLSAVDLKTLAEYVLRQ